MLHLNSIVLYSQSQRNFVKKGYTFLKLEYIFWVVVL